MSGQIGYWLFTLLMMNWNTTGQWAFLSPNVVSWVYHVYSMQWCIYIPTGIYHLYKPICTIFFIYPHETWATLSICRLNMNKRHVVFLAIGMGHQVLLLLSYVSLICTWCTSYVCIMSIVQNKEYKEKKVNLYEQGTNLWYQLLQPPLTIKEHVMKLPLKSPPVFLTHSDFLLVILNGSLEACRQS